MKIVVFGTGIIYKKKVKYLTEETQIVAFLDNNEKLWGTQVDGIKVYSPNDIPLLDYDKILLLSTKDYEMKQQLIEIGVLPEDIWFWRKYCSENFKQIKYYNINKEFFFSDNNGVLIIATECAYNGGTLEAINTYFALKKLNYEPVLCTPGGDETFLTEMSQQGVRIIVDAAITYPQDKELEWIKKFSIVIVDTLFMIKSAVEISKIKPVMLWIHDPESSYKPVMAEFSECCSENALKRIHIVMLSNIAKRNFQNYMHLEVNKKLVFGIPDKYLKSKKIKDKTSKMRFALIGYFDRIKGQDILLEAISHLPTEIYDKTEFVIIGNIGQSLYGKQIIEKTKNYNNVFVLGELKHQEMLEEFSMIDVIICASREETMSISTVEGMMNKKVCIVSDATGISDYINNGVNGYIFSSENALQLAQIITKVVNDKENNWYIEERARKTYETFFSMEQFMINLEKQLIETIEKYKE